MIVVLEGPDLAGKTTVAERAVKRYGGTVIANGPPPPHGSLVQHYLQQIEDARDRGPALTVFDRLHVGELIYGPLFRSTSRLSTQDVSSIEHALEDADATKLHIDAEDSILLSRLQHRGDPLIERGDQLLSIASQYRLLFAEVPHVAGWKTVNAAEALIIIESAAQ